RLWHLLAQEVEGRELFRALLIAIKVNVIADRIGRPKSVNASCRERVFGDDLIEQLLGIIEKFLRLFSNRGIVKDCWIPTAQFPCVKEWRPVNVGRERCESEWYCRPALWLISVNGC